ncbi:Probable transcriptional regulator SLK3 [Striga hermonthica]|uniref:Probable transcriptional regulator SLK3 n=1 Tax=Striga hermonthica TaxID=68872 RepID=A0A9N7RIJ2_STRHE|nr:Probable transcriptional regulator SLK3 [Striga hermonthica]
MVPSRASGGMPQSSSSSGIFFQGDGQSQVSGSSQLSSNISNSMHSIPGRARVSVGPLSGDVGNAVLNSMATSAPSIGASSLVTDANSGLSSGPHMQRSVSFNTESYMRLPTSPLSFTSNNISTSGSSAQQSSNQDQAQAQQNQHSSTTLIPGSRMGQVQIPIGSRDSNSFIQDPNTMSQVQKKPRLDIKQEDVLQQLLQRQDSMTLQNPNSQLQALIQQQRLRQQQQQREQLLQSMPPMQRVQLLQQQQQQQQQLRQQLLQQGMQPSSVIKRPYDGGVCSRRLMQYLYHQRQRPAENTIAYWRKFVAEYYSPRAKKRWCLSLYENVGHHSLGVFPQAAMDAWQCDICGSKSGRGFEATFDALPRLDEIKFGSGIIDELLFLDLPRECRFPSGMMMLEYAKAVSESVYEQLRVVREGQLRIIFTPDLKILSWEFCARRHEELLPRRLVAPQVNQLLLVAQKCQSTISERGPDGVSQPDLQANSVMVVTAGRQLARSLELQSLNDLGFSKRYVRCLQISEVVNSMKDLMEFCTSQKIGPIEGLKNFPRHPSTNTLDKLMAMHPGLNGLMNNNQLEATSPYSSQTNTATPGHSGNLPPPAINGFSQHQKLLQNQPVPSQGSQGLQRPVFTQNQDGPTENPPPSRNDSLKGGPTGENVGFCQKTPDVTRDLHLADELGIIPSRTPLGTYSFQTLNSQSKCATCISNPNDLVLPPSDPATASTRLRSSGTCPQPHRLYPVTGNPPPAIAGGSSLFYSR